MAACCTHPVAACSTAGVQKRFVELHVQMQDDLENQSFLARGEHVLQAVIRQMDHSDSCKIPDLRRNSQGCHACILPRARDRPHLPVGHGQLVLVLGSDAACHSCLWTRFQTQRLSRMVDPSRS